MMESYANGDPFFWASEHRKHFDLAYSYDWDTDNQKVN